MPLTPVEIHTDGACKGNPGPGGWGVRLQSGQHVQELFGGELNTTNNRMEMTAVNSIRLLVVFSSPPNNSCTC